MFQSFNVPGLKFQRYNITLQQSIISNQNSDINNVQQAKRHVKRGRSLFLRKIQIPWKQWKSWNYTLVDEVTKQRTRYVLMI